MCIDHVVPRVSGGSSDINNLLPSCRSCNSSKRHKSLEDYRTWLQWQKIGVEPFTKKQIDYLLACGVSIPQLPDFYFYGELQVAHE